MSTVGCARSIQRLEGSRSICGGRGCYANSIEEEVGLAAPGRGAGEHSTQPGEEKRC